MTAVPETSLMVEWLEGWCAANGLHLDLDSSVGFGRDCVGILDGGEFVDYDLYVDDRDGFRPTPYADRVGPGDEAPNAYHKHTCIAVLGHGDEPTAELYRWVRRLADAGATVERGIPKQIADVGSVFFGQTTRTQIVLPAETA